MRAVARDSAPCRTGRGLAASRRPFGDARSPVRHGAGAPCGTARGRNPRPVIKRYNQRKKC